MRESEGRSFGEGKEDRSKKGDGSPPCMRYNY